MDIERKQSNEINEKDKKIGQLNTELQKYRSQLLEVERKNKEYVEKITSYESSIEKLNKE